MGGARSHKICSVCGAPFASPPSAKTVTCSPACSSIHRSRAQVGVSKAGPSAEAARRAAERTGNLKLGSDAARANPLYGPFETNVEAKRWRLVAPDGERFECVNLRLWCEAHAVLFAPDPWPRAYDGLRMIATRLRRGGGYCSWKGWRLVGIPASPLRSNAQAI